MHSILLLVALSAATPAPSADDSTWVLRSYPMPDMETARRTTQNFATLLWSGGDSGHYIGRVDHAADGTLMVYAPIGFQQGVPALIDKLSKHPLPAPRSMQLKYWVVEEPPRDDPAHASNAGMDVPPWLGELLPPSARRQPNLTDTLSLANAHDREVQAATAEMQVKERVFDSGDYVNASITLERKGDRIDTGVHLVPDRPILLATTHRGDRTTYYVVEVVAAADAAR
jgi:hypothetical protein